MSSNIGELEKYFDEDSIAFFKLYIYPKDDLKPRLVKIIEGISDQCFLDNDPFSLVRHLFVMDAPRKFYFLPVESKTGEHLIVYRDEDFILKIDFDGSVTKDMFHDAMWNKAKSAYKNCLGVENFEKYLEERTRELKESGEL